MNGGVLSTAAVCGFVGLALAVITEIVVSPAYMPRGACFRWDWPVVTAFAVANIGVALAYFAIPIVLLSVVAGRLMPRWTSVAFSVFIFACGSSHLMKVANIWLGWYWAETILDAFTAVVSLIALLVTCTALKRRNHESR